MAGNHVPNKSLMITNIVIAATLHTSFISQGILGHQSVALPPMVFLPIVTFVITYGIIAALVYISRLLE